MNRMQSQEAWRSGVGRPVTTRWVGLAVVIATATLLAPMEARAEYVRAISVLPPQVEGHLRVLVRSLDGNQPTSGPLVGESRALVAERQLGVLSCADDPCEGRGPSPTHALQSESDPSHIALVLDATMPGEAWRHLADIVCEVVNAPNVLPAGVNLSAWRIGDVRAQDRGAQIVAPTRDRGAFCAGVRAGMDARHRHSKSPIYLTIGSALESVAQDLRSGTHREILVITDGEDESCEGDHPDLVQACRVRGIEHLQASALQAGVPISVLIVDSTPPGRVVSLQHLAILRALSQTTHGEHLDIAGRASRQDVTESLRLLLRRVGAVRWVRSGCVAVEVGSDSQLVELITSHVTTTGSAATAAPSSLNASLVACSRQALLCQAAGSTRCTSGPPVRPVRPEERPDEDADVMSGGTNGTNGASSTTGGRNAPHDCDDGEEGCEDDAGRKNWLIYGALGAGAVVLLVLGVLWYRDEDDEDEDGDTQGYGSRTWDTSPPSDGGVQGRARAHQATPTALELGRGASQGESGPTLVDEGSRGHWAGGSWGSDGGPVDRSVAESRAVSAHERTQAAPRTQADPSPSGPWAVSDRWDPPRGIPGGLPKTHVQEKTHAAAPIPGPEPTESRPPLALLRSQSASERGPHLVALATGERPHALAIPLHEWTPVRLDPVHGLLGVGPREADFQVRFDSSVHSVEVRPGNRARTVWLGRVPLDSVQSVPYMEVLHIAVHGTKLPVEVRTGWDFEAARWQLHSLSPGVQTIDVTSREVILGRAPVVPPDWADDGIVAIPLSLEALGDDAARRISSDHVACWVSQGAFFLRDVSANGTWVAGTRLAKGVVYRVAPETEIGLANRVSFRLRRIG